MVWLSGAHCLAHADIVLYNVPNTGLVFVLQGTASTNPGRTVTFRHPKFGTLYLALEDVQKFEMPSTRSLAQGRLRKAEKEKSVESCLAAARWALHSGLLDVFYEAASAAWKIDKDNPVVQRLAAMNRRINTKIPESKALEKEMLDFAQGVSNMEFQRSDHFLLLHDTPSKQDRRSKKTRR